MEAIENELNLETMKILLQEANLQNLQNMQKLISENNKKFMSELANAIKSEVTKQISAYVGDLHELKSNYAALEMKLSDLSSKVEAYETSPKCSIPQNPNKLPNSQIEIETARRTLYFGPITADGEPLSNSSSRECLEEGFKTFLKENMNVAENTIEKLQVKNIALGNSNNLKVEFSSFVCARIIFQHLKNLQFGQRVSIHVPDVLEAKFEELRNRAYHLRNNPTEKVKTLIKYTGYELALYVKPKSSNNTSIWEKV